MYLELNLSSDDPTAGRTAFNKMDHPESWLFKPNDCHSAPVFRYDPARSALVQLKQKFLYSFAIYFPLLAPNKEAV